ncbi:MAG: hypothetical protein L6R37_005561 [Teloschistes peruensis]|nr:MAG: hypothetical protein L6R37_005561 [Teloschistes peruensis]
MPRSLETRPLVILPPTAYAGMLGCVREFLNELNQAIKKPDKDEEEHGKEGDSCAICHNTVGSRSDREGSSLSIIALPQCGHRFHELCLLNWLSPIALPPTSPIGSAPSSPSSRSTLGGIGPTLEYIAAAYGYYEQEDTGSLARLIGTAEATPDDDLEEGEVREDELTNQALPFFNLFNGRFRPIAILRTMGTAALSHTCPLCRLPAFSRDEPYCHGDNLVFLRARLRLANLARECCGISWTMEDESDSDNVADFLDRRTHDNLVLGEREVPIDPAEARGYFLVARLVLVEDAYSQLQNLTRWTEHRTKGLLLLISFMKNFVLRERHRNYFFDPNPRSIDEWELQSFEDSPTLLYEDPEAFCERLQLKDGDDSDGSSDDGSASLTSEVLEAGRVRRETNTRFRMAIAELLDDSHDNDAEMEEASPTDDAAPQSEPPIPISQWTSFSSENPPH